MAMMNGKVGKKGLLNATSMISLDRLFQKAAEELDLEDVLGHSTFNIQALSLGYNRIVWQKHDVDLAAGAKATLDFPAAGLKPIYGKIPWASSCTCNCDRHYMCINN